MPLCKIDIGHPSFRGGAKEAAKRHRSFQKELTTVMAEIEKSPMTVGDQIKCSNLDFHVRKVRIGAPGENVQPRAGYRLIFQVLEQDGRQWARMLDVYYKQHQGTIKGDAVERLVNIAPAL